MGGVKFNTKVDTDILRQEAKEYRDILKISLKGLKSCENCKNDTIILISHEGNGHFKTVINACCSEFENRLKERIFYKKEFH